MSSCSYTSFLQPLLYGPPLTKAPKVAWLNNEEEQHPAAYELPSTARHIIDTTCQDVELRQNDYTSMCFLSEDLDDVSCLFLYSFVIFVVCDVNNYTMITTNNM